MDFVLVFNLKLKMVVVLGRSIDRVSLLGFWIMAKRGSGKVTWILVLLAVVIGLATFVVLNDFRATVYAVFPDGAIDIPEVREGVEVEYKGYKFSNTSGVIVSTEPVVHCRWKPDGEDDGWKECEAVFEVENLKDDWPKLYAPQIGFDFVSDDVRNLEISYSDSYDVVEESRVEHSEEVNEIYVKRGSVEEQGERSVRPGITGMAVSAEEVDGVNEIKVAKPIKEGLMKRKFESFRKIPIGTFDVEEVQEVVEEESEEVETGSDNGRGEKEDILESMLDLNETINETETEENETVIGDGNETFEGNETSEGSRGMAEEIEVVGNETPEESDESNSTSVGENESVGGGFIHGMAVSKKEESGDEVYINTRRPFAIRITFEVPRYESNQFDFQILEGDFNAAIDPEVSECGTLDSEGATYTLEEGVSASGTCFTVTANDVTINCQGNEINFSAFSGGFGVQSIANRTKVENCVVRKVNRSVTWSYNIYLSNSLDSEISGNTIIADGQMGTTEVGVYLDSSSGTTVTANNFTFDGASPSGTYLVSGSENVVVDSNNLTLSSTYDSYALYADSSSNLCNYTSNKISVSGDSGYAGLFSEVSDFKISGNEIDIGGSSGYAFYLEDAPRFDINSNIISHGADSGLGIEVQEGSDSTEIKQNVLDLSANSAWAFYFYGVSGLNISGNNVSVAADGSYAFYSYSLADSEISNQRFEASGTGSSAFLIEAGSDSNVIINNVFNTTGNDCYAVLFERSDSNRFLDNSVFTTGGNSSGINISQCNNTVLSRNTISTQGSSAHGFFTTGSKEDFSRNTISTGGVSSSGVYSLGGEENSYVWNVLSVVEENSYGFRLSEVVDSTVANNTVSTERYESPALYLDSGSNSNSILNNSFMTSGSSSRVVSVSESNSNLFDGNFINSTDDVATGFYFSQVSEGIVRDNLVTVFGDDSYGVHLTESTGIDFSNNEIQTFGVSVGTGLYLVSGSSYNTFYSDSVLTGGEHSDGVFIETSNRNNFSSFLVNTFGNLADGLQFSVSTDLNLFDGAIILVHNSSARGVYAYDGSHNFSFYDSVIDSHNSSHDFYAGDSVLGEWNFTNVSLGTFGFGSGVVGKLNELWYLDSLVRYSSGSGIPGANVSVRDAFELVINSSYLTGSDGRIETLELLQAVNNSTSFYQYSNFTVNVTIPDGRSSEQSTNLSTNRDLFFVFEGGESGEEVNTGGGGGSGSGRIIGDCLPKWICSAWTECKKGIQERECVNELPDCGSSKPIEIRSCGGDRKDNLFDVRLDLMNDLVYPGRSILASVTLVNIGVPGAVDATVYYQIMNSDGQVVFEETEQVSLETQIEYIKEFETAGFGEDVYTLLVDLSYEGQKAPAESESRFTVSKAFLSPGSPGGKVFAFAIVLGVIVIAFVAKKYRDSLPAEEITEAVKDNSSRSKGVEERDLGSDEEHKEEGNSEEEFYEKSL